MAREAKVPWSQTQAGVEAYRAVKATAQANADGTGFDHGIWPNDIFREWTVRMLPMRQNRYGHELACEVVMCSDLSKCQVGHGPMGGSR